ncbi:unnamed protein product [Closterium sp. NIES-54]
MGSPGEEGNSAPTSSGSQESGVSAPRIARTSQGPLLREVLKNFSVDKFSGEGYDDWSWKMRLYFRQIGLLKLMIGTEKRPSTPELQNEWDERSSAGYYILSQSLDLAQRQHIMHLLPEECGPKAWRVLKDLHAPTSVVATLMLERELSTLNLSEGEPVQPVLDKLRDLHAKLAIAGIVYPEQTKCMKMMSLLPESWMIFTSGLSLPQNQSSWTLEWIRTKILEEDFRRRQLRGGEEGSSSYTMQGGKRGKGKNWQGAGRGASKEESSNQQGGRGAGRGGGRGGRGGGRGPGRMEGKCWYCEKVGHPWFKCRTKPTWWTPSNRTQDGNGAGAVADDEPTEQEEREAGQFFHVGEPDEDAVVAHAGAALHPLNTWILDTGAAWTMTPRADLLEKVGTAPIEKVKSASGHALKVTGVGRAAFKGADGKPVVLSDVLLVPDLKANLISLRKLGKCGVSTSTEGAKTFTGQLGKRVLWDLHESRDICNSM